jgi:hypothetical protein
MNRYYVIPCQSQLLQSRAYNILVKERRMRRGGHLPSKRHPVFSRIFPGRVSLSVDLKVQTFQDSSVRHFESQLIV